MSDKPTRRTFSKAAAGSVAALSAVGYGRVLGANDRVRLGIIGVGNRGDQLLDAFLAHQDMEIAAISDVYEPYVPAAQKKVGGEPKTYKDYRKMLSNNGIDAVIIATPDHWHAMMFVDACKAGKDVYVEKPASLTIGEGRVMCRVAEETKRVTQVGLHRRSSLPAIQAVELIHAGAIGKITMAKAYFHRNETPMGIGNPADGEPPAGLDWDSWLGPAPKTAFNRNKCLYKFRWFHDYSGGQVTNQGTHYLDVIQWALKQNAPKAVAALGGVYAVTDNRECPDTMEVIWEYDGCLATFSQLNGNGAKGNPLGWDLEFRGTLGTMYVSNGKDGFTIVPESVRLEELPALSPIDRAGNSRQGRAVKKTDVTGSYKPGKTVQRGNSSDTAMHARNFLDCVKSRKTTHCPIETGHRSTTATTLARMALARRATLHWDAEKERVTNDEAANKMLTYTYRKPWVLG